MAAVKSKSEGSPSKTENKGERHNKSDVLSFRIFDACLILLSLSTFVVDLSTDVILVVDYFNHGHIYWAVSTLLLIILPMTVIQMFSMRWHITDETANHCHWIVHIFLLGLVHRYVQVFKTGLEARSSGDLVDFQRLYHQQSDICMLHLFESFMESAPQLVLQLYIMISVEDWHSWTGISAAASLVSLAWAVAAYTRAMRRARPDKQCVSWTGLILQAAWRGGMITARVITLVLFAVGFRAWLFLLIGVHWLGMTTWIIFQKTDFCQTPWEERIYNCVVGVIYCFCFFNLQEGQSRKRALTFYVVTVAQNMGCLGLFISLEGSTRPGLAQIGIAAIVGGTVLGLTSMLLYYGFFHPIGHIKLCETSIKRDSKLGTPPHHKPSLDPENMATIRSLKHLWLVHRDGTSDRINDAPFQEGSPHSDDTCTDKKLLLTHWGSCQTATPADVLEASLELMSAGHDEMHMSCEVSDTSQMTDDIRRQKRRGICSPQALELELEGDKKEMGVENDIDARKQKRRGICSLEREIEVELELGVSVNKREDDEHKQSSEVECISDIQRQKRRGICSSVDVSLEFNQDNEQAENVKNESCVEVELSGIENLDNFECNIGKEKGEEQLNDLKQLRLAGSEDSPSEVLSAPSEVLSAHDYENICAVNIAREAWGLRSWRGYSDIETWLHDDSVVRDRRRDTLTSTATTLTSASSEHSTGSGEHISLATSPPPLPCRRPRIQRSRQDDYLDTLVDDLADCESGRPLAEFESEPDLDPSVFVARPYVVDQHGTLFPLTTLDTIMEELEESSTDTGELVRHRHRHGSASTLVATIDEIRHGSSICNLYNSSELLWDVSRDDSLNMTDDQIQPGCENILQHAHSHYSDSLPRSLLTTTHSRSHLSPEEVLFLSQLQTTPDTEVDSSTNPSSHRRDNSSKQNREVILDATPYILSCQNKPEISEFGNLQEKADVDSSSKKKSGTRPRRKFSLLRERFETKYTEKKNETGLDLISDSLSSSHSFQTSQTNSFLNAMHSEPASNEVSIKIPNESPGLPNEPMVCYNKENVIPAVTSRIKQWNNFLKTQNTCNSKLNPESYKLPALESSPNSHIKPSFTNLKERRSVFLKQVLSPPKFQSWTKKGSPSPNSMEVHAS